MFEYRFKAKCVRVIDGDTYEMDVDLGFYVGYKTSIRIRGVDTPETHNTPAESEEHKAGLKAKARVMQLIEGKQVILKTEKLKRTFERWVADVYFTGADGKEYSIAEIIVQEGLTKQAFLETQSQ